ncbi:MAG: hypothetical protein J6J86_03260, partial [Lachnospiraceae bacterium]|nr:hypothetical protein [Lachnospiraceae bacterium]
MEYQTVEGKGSVFIVEEGSCGEESYQIEMLKKNHFPGLLPVQVSVIDEQKEYYYDAGRRMTLAAYLERKTINEEMLQSYLIGMKDLLAFLEEYLLEPDCLCMRADHIYVDEKEQLLSFCYGPYVQGQFEEGLLKLWQFFLQKLDYSDKQSVIMGYEIYQNIVREGYASAFTYRRREEKEEPEILFPWEENEDGQFRQEGENEAERKEESSGIQLSPKWKFYAAGV